MYGKTMCYNDSCRNKNSFRSNLVVVLFFPPCDLQHRAFINFLIRGSETISPRESWSAEAGRRSPQDLFKSGKGRI